jgi:type IV pilus assembly protein PilV
MTPAFTRATRIKQRGFSLLEVLVTLTITAVALLGAAGLQMRALQTGQSSQARSQAVLLASDLAERMEANKNAATNGNYRFTSGSSLGTVSDCSVEYCQGPALAVYDLSQWNAQIPLLLPQATSWSVSATVANPIVYTITINWTDRSPNTTLGGSVTGSGEPMSYQSSRTVYYLP